jgi:predicted CoA-binding protein
MKEAIEKFFSSPAYAVIGVSPDRKKFGNVVFRDMTERHFVVYPVNPKHQMVEGVKCFSSVTELPVDVQSVVTVVPPEVTEQVLGECAQKGIRNVWMQPGSESKAALDFAVRNDMAVVSRECILMFLEPVKSFHALHRMLRKLVGRYPK